MRETERAREHEALEPSAHKGPPVGSWDLVVLRGLLQSDFGLRGPLKDFGVPVARYKTGLEFNLEAHGTLANTYSWA